MAGQIDLDVLLDACIHDKRFDRMIDDVRGDWLWLSIQAIGAESRFRQPIFDALGDLSENNVLQVCQISYHYAAHGDHVFRDRLYEIVRDKPFNEERSVGEEELVRLDGESGFLFAARIRGQQLENRDWEWDDRSFLKGAMERLGERRVNELLDAASDEAMELYRRLWLQDKAALEKARSSHQARADQMRQIPAKEIIFAAETSPAKHTNFRGWGIWATEDDLEEVFQRLLSSTDSDVLVNLLKVFSRREFPRIVPELIALTRHSSPEVLRWAFNALENNSHPLVRELAEHQLGEGLPNPWALGLFIRNYRDGDEQRIFDIVELPGDINQRHCLLMDARKIQIGRAHV